MLTGIPTPTVPFNCAFDAYTDLLSLVLKLLNDSTKDDPEMPLAMAAYRALNEVVKRSKGTASKEA